MIGEWDILIRLLIAAGLGAAVGFERELSQQPAGLRTHIILVVGATLAMTLSVNLAIQFQPLVPNGDPARLAAQVISGIGFLGAGAIFRYGVSIKGLTTATSLWTMAVVGLVVGVGLYLAAVGATILILIVLFAINIIEDRFINPYLAVTLTLSATDRPALLKDLKKLLDKQGVKYARFSIQKNIKRKTVRIETQIRVHNEEGVEPLMAEISIMPGVRAFRLV
jgi:putative Mg2+ transporter-C (MgtC) family protein